MSQVFWRRSDSAATDRPALFLDRDGVVVEEVNHLGRPKDVRVLNGAREVVGGARRVGCAIGLVTNQAGVGRGYYDWNAFEAVQAELEAQLGLGPEPFDFVAACGTHPEAALPELRVPNHPWRKPAPGMLLKAAEALRLDLASSVMVGDQLTDLQAGLAAGVGHLVHVRTGHGASGRDAVEAFAAEGPRVTLLASLADLPGALGWTLPGPLDRPMPSESGSA